MREGERERERGEREREERQGERLVGELCWVGET